MAYATSLDHLQEELERADLLLRLGLARRRDTDGGARPHPAAPSDEEDLFALLDRGADLLGALSPAPLLVEAQAQLERATAEIASRSAESAHHGVPLRLATLAERFGLERFDLDVLLLALLAHIDRGAARRLARLAPEGGGRLTVGAALDLLAPTFAARLAARARLDPCAPLLRHDLVRLAADPADARAPLLARTIDVEERIAAYLEDGDDLDPRLRPHARLVTPRARLDDLLLPEPLKQGLARFVAGRRGEREPAPVVYLQGPEGAGKRTAVEALCGLLGARLVAIDCAGPLAAGEGAFAAAARLAGREARLSAAAMHWIGADAALDEDRPIARAALLDALAEHDGPAFLSGGARWEADGALAGRAFVRVEVPRPSAAEQAQLWERALGEARAPDVDLAALTSAFRLTGGQIRDAAGAAQSLARFRGDGRVAMTDVTGACRLRHGRKLSALARRIPPLHGWDDLVLPPERKALLRELCLQLKHRSRVLGGWGFERRVGLGRPLAALFSGGPGTGKTMAASVIAAELGVDLYHIDLSRVVSKYIGETEKHLAGLFADAEAANAALFFDEADAIFGKRTEVRDAHDRFANVETSYLLQRIETYEGVVILASNLARNIDEAFVRRLGFVVDFPSPAPPERLRIWQGIWPEEAPLGPDIDLAFLAERIDLSGGYIRNIALAAAFLAVEDGAPVGMRHLLHAARREYQKMGKVIDAGRLAYPAKGEGR